MENLHKEANALLGFYSYKRENIDVYVAEHLIIPVVHIWAEPMVTMTGARKKAKDLIDYINKNDGKHIVFIDGYQKKPAKWHELLFHPHITVVFLTNNHQPQKTEIVFNAEMNIISAQ